MIEFGVELNIITKERMIKVRGDRLIFSNTGSATSQNN